MSHPVGYVGADPSAPLDTSGGDVVASHTLWRPQWGADELSALCESLGERRLFVVEPTSGLGYRRLLQWLAAPLWRRRLGYDYNRDLPTDLRAAGFQIHAIDRFTVGRLTIRTYFYGELGRRRHPLEAGFDADRS